MASTLWKYIKPSIDALVFSNTWISLGATSMYLSTKLLFDLAPVFYEALLIFAATFLAYNILKLRGLDFEENQSPFNLWMRRHKNSIYALMALAALAVLYTLSQIAIYQLIILSFTILISLIYIGIERFSLRAFWFFKTQLVAFVWALFILGIALANYWGTLNILAIFILFAAVFFFILALTIPFEIRDWHVDMLAPKLKTIPMIFGLKGTLILSLVHLILSLLLFLLFSFQTIILFPLFIYAGLKIYALNQDSPEWHYTTVIDGLIILIYPLLYLGNHLF